MGKKNKLANQESNTNLEKEVSPESEINFMNTSKASLKEYSKSAPFAFDARNYKFCLLYTSPSPRDRQKSRMPSSA